MKIMIPQLISLAVLCGFQHVLGQQNYFNLTSPVDRIMYVSLGSNFTIVSKYVCQGQGCNTIDVIWYFKSTNGTLKSIEIDENERISIIDQSSLFVEDASFDDNGTFICDLEGPGFLSFSATIIIKEITPSKPIATPASRTCNDQVGQNSSRNTRKLATLTEQSRHHSVSILGIWSSSTRQDMFRNCCHSSDSTSGDSQLQSSSWIMSTNTITQKSTTDGKVTVTKSVRGSRLSRHSEVNVINSTVAMGLCPENNNWCCSNGVCRSLFCWNVLFLFLREFFW